MSTPSLKKITTSYVVPLILLVLIVGGIAWVTQNHRRWWVPKSHSGQAVTLAFKHPVALLHPRPTSKKEGPKWEDQPDNFKEIEVGSHAYYDFPFSNAADSEVEVRLIRPPGKPSCDC